MNQYLLEFLYFFLEFGFKIAAFPLKINFIKKMMLIFQIILLLKMILSWRGFLIML